MAAPTAATSAPAGLFAPGGDRAWVVPAAAVGGAALLSILLIWLATQDAVIAAAFFGMGLLALALVWAVQRMLVPSADAPLLATSNDWTLVRGVAQATGQAIAITDRSGRLVCANDFYCEWFGGAVTPPALPVEPAAVALLTEAGRTGWRDGEAAVASFANGDRIISGMIARVGRADDHLLWRFSERRRVEPLLEAISQLRGPVGRALGEAGVMAAIVSANGTVRASNEALRLRATGSLAVEIDGQDFASALRVDAQGLLRFARERDASTPLRILEIPFDRSEAQSPLLLLMIDEDGSVGEQGVALDYVERLLASLPFGLAMLDRDGRFLFTNEAFAPSVGGEVGKLPTWPADLLVPDDRAALGEAVRRHAARRSGSSSIGVRIASQPDEPISIGLLGVRGMGDAAVLLTLEPKNGAKVADIGQASMQATKMQAVGQLAGGIAHDFNNVLTGILGNCDLMLMRHTPGDSDYDDIQQIRSNANRAANLTRQLLAFSRQQTLRPQILNLSDIVADVSHLLERLIGSGVQLAVQHGRGLGPVRADPGQLEQVIVNLAVNARDAMPDGGLLTIATRAIGAADVAVMAGDTMPPGDYAMVSVSDTGHGIAADVLPKIFDPFFTTKEVGKGTGLGLATVYGIVKQSGGFIFADSSVGQGTVFSVYLPVHVGSDVAEAPRVAAPVARATSWGSGNILLVEDEDMVRAVADRALSRAGYTVTTASHGEEGLEKYAAMDGVDMVVTDVMMPMMDGPTMVAAIRAQHPKVPVLFMSGYAEEQLRQKIALPNVAFLSKPFSVAQLVDAIAAIRDGHGVEVSA